MCAPWVAYRRRSDLGDVVFMVPEASKSSQLITLVTQAHTVPPILLLWSSSSIFASRLHACGVDVEGGGVGKSMASSVHEPVQHS
jgi:hypothetical protein